MRIPLLLALVGSVWLSGCMAQMASKGGHFNSGEIAIPPPPEPSPEPVAAVPPQEAKAPITLAVVEPRRVIYSGTFNIVVPDVTSALDSAKKLAEEMGGYVQRISNEQIVLRVPAQKFDEAAAAIAKLGWVASRDINSEDVSDRYTDLEIRLRNSKALRDRLAQLLEKNNDHKQVVEMEQELSRVTTQIEELEAQINRLANQVAFATLTVKFSPKPQNVPAGLRVQLPFGWLRTLGLGTLMSFDGRNLY